MDPQLPTGTLTLLFSDIEGSTALLRRLGDAYAEVLTAHRALLREVFARRRGVELTTEGDSFFVVFPSVGDALLAALEGQRALAGHPWPSGAQVRVRMGLHTGEPVRHEDGYVGMDVHLAARVCSAAHGGQVVLTEATELIAADQSPPGVTLLDLGRHRLKDIPRPVHLYQLAADGLDRQFPPLRSLGGRTALPVPVTSTVGRDGELRELTQLLADGATHLVTLTGPGGSGKTRLAVALADSLVDDFPDGVFFIPLEAVTTAGVMWTALADALGLAGEERAPEALVEHLARRRVLIVLDNLEQLPEASKVVHELLTAPELHLVATSRRPLHVYGEHEHAVPPLELPATRARVPDDVAGCGAVQLFVQRAQMVRPAFELGPDNVDDVTEICRLLDGLPLAIELAAARVKLLSPHALRQRLASSLDVLSARQADRPSRQQTLADAVTWSYQLLPAQQQWFLRQLGVFAGDFDLEAVAAVVGEEFDPFQGIDELVDASLVSVRDGPDGEPRVHLLRTVATYVRRWLTEAGELEAARRRHGEHYAALAEGIAPELRSGGGYLLARDRIEQELDNLRAVLTWTLPAGADPAADPDGLALGLRVCQALSWYWYACGYQNEGRQWLGRAVTAASGGAESPELMLALHGLGILLLQHGENEQGRDALLTCLAFWRRTGDDTKVGMELSSLGAAYRSLHDFRAARAALEESIAIARATGNKGRLATALSNLALVDLDEGRPGTATERLQEALVLDRELGDPWGVAADQVNLAAALAVQEGRTEEAYRALREMAADAVALGDVDLTANLLELFAMVLADLGDARRSARVLGTAQTLRRVAELPITEADAELIERSISKVRSADGAWEHDVAIGAEYTVDEALELAVRDAM